MYEDGVGVEKSLSKSMVWYCRAANQGDADSQSDIVHFWERNWGFEDI